VAPMPKASFMLRVLMPMALAAISSSRIAIQARPMREFAGGCNHHGDTTPETGSNTSTPRRFLKPKTRGFTQIKANLIESIWLMPWGRYWSG
jgi:hypothetical protein